MACGRTVGAVVTGLAQTLGGDAGAVAVAGERHGEAWTGASKTWDYSTRALFRVICENLVNMHSQSK